MPQSDSDCGQPPFSTSSTMSHTLAAAVVLPPELLDIIIGFLYDDIPTLASCALVCKDWLPSSRSHLFHTLILNSWNSEKFLPLLKSPLHGPAIAPHVRELWIIEDYGYHAWFNEGLPVMCMGVLRSVTSLHVDQLHWEKLGGESRAALMSFLHSVEELTLMGCKFQTFDQFTEVVSEPRSLRKLEMFGTVWKDGATVELDRLPCPSQLQALDLFNCTSPILRWLLQHESCYRMLKILKVDDRSVGAASIELFGQFLQALDSTLESLSVEVSGCESFLHLSLLQFYKSG
jgi:hypothetical protein